LPFHFVTEDYIAFFYYFVFWDFGKNELTDVPAVSTGSFSLPVPDPETIPAKMPNQERTWEESNPGEFLRDTWRWKNSAQEKMQAWRAAASRKSREESDHE
jgi:hypothetical protein